MSTQRPDRVLQGSRVRLRPLEEEDAQHLVHWKPNVSPLLEGYNYGQLDDWERRAWIDEKRHGRNRYFAVDVEDRPLIGYLGAKQVNLFRRSAFLGIVFDAAYQSQGYGTEALQLFLDWYFETWRMKRLDLYVNQFNHRAIALYEKMGFRRVGERKERFENQALSFDDLALAPQRIYFERRNALWYSRLWMMRKERSA